MNTGTTLIDAPIASTADNRGSSPHHDCVFCRTSELSILAENTDAFAVMDAFPARPMHMLILPKRHVTSIFETTVDEREAIHELALLCRQRICEADSDVGGFNFGSNVGAAAGQKIFHAHVHLIPRRSNDTELPPAQAD